MVARAWSLGFRFIPGGYKSILTLLCMPRYTEQISDIDFLLDFLDRTDLAAKVGLPGPNLGIY